MRTIKNLLLSGILLFLGAKISTAQGKIDPEYVKVTNERAQKIVDGLQLHNEEKELRVRDIIASQYRLLSAIHENRDGKREKIKGVTLSEEKRKTKIGKIEKKANEKVRKLHRSYVQQLRKELNEEQVVAVKDGMTYGVVPLTYNGYLDMLPDLTESQKKMIYDYLVEARELAMDAGSSKEKHAWFGKYKGKINNELSADGYDLNKESKNWHQRLETEKKSN